MNKSQFENELSKAYKSQNTSLYNQLYSDAKRMGYRILRNNNGDHRLVSMNDSFNRPGYSQNNVYNTGNTNNNPNSPQKGTGCVLFLVFLIILGAVIIPAITSKSRKNNDDTKVQPETTETTEMTTESNSNNKKGDIQDYSYNVENDAVLINDTSGMGYAGNIVVVYFSPSATEEDKQNVVSRLNGEIVGRLDTLNQLQIKIESKGYDELKALCSEIEAMNNVDIASIDTVSAQGDIEYYPSDGYTDDWDINNPGGQNWGQEAIKAPEMWYYREYMHPISVGVIDSGFDVIHEDLLGHISISEVSKDPSLCPDHGTSTSGIIGAGMDNGIGITGMAPNAVITGYSLGKDTDISSTEIFEDVIHAVKDGNKVVNISMGCSKRLENCNLTWDYNYDGKTASKVISDLLDEGYDFIIVQSAGNGAYDGFGVDSVYNGQFCSITRENCFTERHSYEEIMDHVIVVAAATQTESGFVLDNYSNGGSTTTLCAPGTDIYLPVSGNNYDYKRGTSFSAPLVSGSLTAIWGLKPSLTAKEMKSIICDSSDTFIPTNPEVSAYSGECRMLNVTNATLWATVPEAEDEYDSAGEESFYTFLKNYYDSADEYCDGNPVHKDPDSGYGGTAWRDYIVVDFDSDGQNELLITEAFSKDSVYRTDGLNMYFISLYELENGVVTLKNKMCLSGDYEELETCVVYDNQVLYCEARDPNSQNFYIFDENERNRLGLLDYEFLSYTFYDDGDIMRYHPVSYLGEGALISNEDYKTESDSILTGNPIEFTIHHVTETGIEEIAQ